MFYKFSVLVLKNSFIKKVAGKISGLIRRKDSIDNVKLIGKYAAGKSNTATIPEMYGVKNAAIFYPFLDEKERKNVALNQC